MRGKLEIEEMPGGAEVTEGKHGLQGANNCKNMRKIRAKNENVVDIYQEKNGRGRGMMEEE